MRREANYYPESVSDCLRLKKKRTVDRVARFIKIFIRCLICVYIAIIGYILHLYAISRDWQIGGFFNLLSYFMIADLAIKFFFMPSSILFTYHFLALPIRRRILYAQVIKQTICSFGTICWVLLACVLLFLSAIESSLEFSKGIFILLISCFSGMLTGILNNILQTIRLRNYWISIVLLAVICVAMFFFGRLNCCSQPNCLIVITTLLSVLTISLVFFGYLFCKMQYWRSENIPLSYRSLIGLTFSGSSLKSMAHIYILQFLRCIILKRLLITIVLFLSIGYISICQKGGVLNTYREWFILFLPMVPMLFIGQYVISCTTTYFDGLHSKPLSMNNIIESYYLVCIAATALYTILIIPAVADNFNQITMLLSAAIFSCGIVGFTVFQIGIYAENRFDPSKQDTSSWMSGKQQLISYLSSIPFVFLIVGKELFSAIVLCLILSSLGFIGMISSHVWIKQIVKKFNKDKYSKMDHYRTQK